MVYFKRAEFWHTTGAHLALGLRCLRYLLLVMCTYPFAKKELTLHLAHGEGRERYFGCNLMQRKVLAASHQYFNGGSTRNSTQNSRPFHRTGEDGELLAKSDILGSQLATSLEGRDESANKRRNHAGMIPADRRLIKFGARE